MGGGEQHMGAIALGLARCHDVELVTHAPVDLDELRRQLGIDLGQLRLRLVPLDHAYRSVEACTRDYDLFVNCSHLDIFRPRARWNAMLVFFPGPLPPDDPGACQGRLFAIGGFHAPEGRWVGGFRWTDGVGRLLLRHLELGSDHRIRLLLRSARSSSAAPARVRLLLNTEPLGPLRVLPPCLPAVIEEVIPAERIHDQQMLLRLESDTFAPTVQGKRLDLRTLGVRLLGAGLRVASGARGDSEEWRTGRTLPYWSSVRANTEDELDYHQLLFANSRYTQRWIRERWHRPSRVLYPLVQVSGFAPGRKRCQIISVGRFFMGSHNKKHIPMIRAFRGLCDGGLTGWTYHLVGGTHAEPEHREYLRQVRAAAEGYPIQIHADIPLERLRELYAGSDLYWNATGLGEDERELPEAFEHFGITTVEAMASGCVPVSFARAGQPEIIEHGVDGVLWDRLEQCQALTLELIRDPPRRARMAVAAEAGSQRFGPEAFQATLDPLVDELLRSGPSGLVGSAEGRKAMGARLDTGVS
jgi:glycosyltransferase involved in cell wall biosynthesis